jgi:YD repeat-containing protein
MKSSKCFLFCLSFFVLLFFPNLNFSQSSPKLFDVKSLVPTSPEAGMLGRFGDIPIGYYTGTSNISIPLYTIKDAGVEIPIVLSYHGSGIKVGDEATKVGLGWFLEPEASIVQIINGAADNNNVNGGDMLPYDDANGYTLLKSRMTSSYNVFPSLGTVGKIPNTCCRTTWGGGCATLEGDNPATISGLLRGEGQPDMYQYSFAGYSGKFYINPETGKVVLIDKKSYIKFEKLGAVYGPAWLATTLDGNKFYFDVIETASNNTLGNYSTKTVKLSKIILHNSKVINFIYYNGSYQSTSYNETFHEYYPYNLATNEFGVVPSSSYYFNNTKTLTTISTDEVSINFNLEDRVDLWNTDDNDGDNSNGVLSTKRIKSIDIISNSNNKKIKTFNFYYSYFPYVSVGASYNKTDINSPTATAPTQAFLNAEGYRLKLDSLAEIGYDPVSSNQISNPAYKFDYDATTLPFKSSFARDFWGYYNGQNNSSLMPDLSYFYYSGNSSFQDFPSSLFSIINGANRFANISTMSAGTLKKITYPTGGYTEFDYTSNAFSNYIYPDNDRINSTKKNVSVTDMNQSADIVSQNFTLPNREVLKFTNTIVRGNDASVTFESLLPATITLYKILNFGTSSITATPIKVWQMINNNDERQNFINNGYVKIWNEEVNIDYDPNAVYSIIVNLPNNIIQSLSGNIAKVSSNFIYYTSSVSSNSSNGGGLRISEIRNYSGQNQLITKKVIRYVNEDGNNSGKLMSPLQFYFKRDLIFGKGVLSSASSDTSTAIACNEYYSAGSYLFMQSEGSIPFSSGAQGHNVGYSRVEEENIDYSNNLNKNGVHAYKYHNVPDYNTPVENTPNDPDLMNGLIMQEDIIDANSELVKSTVYNFSNFSTEPVFTGAKIYSNYLGDDYWGDASGQLFLASNITMGNLPDGKYKINCYPMNNGWYLLSSKTSSYLSKGKNLNEIENYQYNTLGQLVTINKIDSKQQQITNSFLYPSEDYASTGSIQSAALISQGLYNNLIEQKKIVNGNEVENIHLDYWFNNNQVTNAVVNTAIRKSYHQQPFFTDIQFDLYDSKKKLLQFTEKGITNSILWGYNNSYPVAEIVGSDYSTVNNLVSQAQIDAATNSISDDNSIRTLLNGIRSGLSNSKALVTTYTYKPLVGMTSQTDPAGHTMYYEYDGFNRLKLIRDKDNNILKKFDYQYTNTSSPVGGGTTVYYNVVQSGIFQKNCSNGLTGSSVTYTIPANTYSSTVSQDDANNKAIADVNANGQAYANNNGTCTGGCTTATCSGEGYKCVNGLCEFGIQIFTATTYDDLSGWYQCTYHYEWSDGSWSSDITVNRESPCF